jgi:hypothetical protein
MSDWFRKLLRRIVGRPTAPGDSQWCLVGNVIGDRVSDDGTSRAGTKHFRPGTKVYCLPPQWGDGYEKIIVVGMARRPRGFITIVISRTLIANWRTQVVYQLAVLERLREGLDGHQNQWKSRADVEKMLAFIQSSSADAG